MTQIVKGKLIKLNLGDKSILSEYHLPSEYMKQMDILLESDITMLKSSTHFVKLDIEVYLPIGYLARVMNDNSVYTDKGVSVIGEYIYHGSHNKRIKFYLRNETNNTVHLKRGDLIGKLGVFEMADQCSSFNVDIRRKNEKLYY